MAEPVPAGIRVAQVVGITGAAWLSGGICSFSLYSVPAIGTSPAPLRVKQFTHLYNMGKSSAPPIAITASACLGYLAFDAHKTHAETAFRLFSLSAVLVSSIVPFTILILSPTNDALFKKQETLVEKIDDNDPETDSLLRKWRAMNLCRALLTGIGAVTAAWTVVSTL